MRIHSLITLLALILPTLLATAPAAAQPCPAGCSGNGQCFSGRCICQAGWTGIDCATATCDGRCFNGQCIAGSCVCEPGWGGPACLDPACAADYNANTVADTADIFAFLSLWFADDFRADFNDSGGSPNVADIFDFLGAWFEGC